jgi:multidrug resistance efflux pump
MAHQVFRAHLLTKSPRPLLLLSLVFLLLVGLFATAMMVVPWRQTVIAHGQVAIYDPMQRPQPVDAQIKGRLVKLLVAEGQDVKKGQLLAILDDRDSKYLDPQQQQRWQQQLEALSDKKDATESQVNALRGQAEALVDATSAALPSAEAKTSQTRQKLAVLRQQLRVGEQDVVTAKLQKERLEDLFSQGLRSKRDLELAVQKLVETETYLQKMHGDLQLAETDIELAKLERAKIAAELSEKQDKVAESIAKAQGELAELREKTEKVASEASALKVRNELQKVYAPIDGRIIKMSEVGPGHMIKEGDTLATIIPPQQELSVELYVRGLDTPLVEVGRPVRLMFEGFPAVPFPGWPWAAVGTFGGIVTVIDPVVTDSKEKSGFRIWVRPDPAEPAWPTPEHLRIDSKVSGWVMLDDVPLYYEIWRQLNAFPARPALDATGEKVKTKPVIRR